MKRHWLCSKLIARSSPVFAVTELVVSVTQCTPSLADLIGVRPPFYTKICLDFMGIFF